MEYTIGVMEKGEISRIADYITDLEGVLAEKGIEEKANWIRHEFLTGTAIAVIVALMILLVNPKSGRSMALGLIRRCPVYDHRLIGSPNYCGDCGSKVS